MNLNVGYWEHSQQGVSVNLPKQTNDSKHNKKTKIYFNIKERREQSEIINKTSVSRDVISSLNISDSKIKSETDHSRKSHKSFRG